jgi:hypothetical protein
MEEPKMTPEEINSWAIEIWDECQTPADCAAKLKKLIAELEAENQQLRELVEFAQGYISSAKYGTIILHSFKARHKWHEKAAELLKEEKHDS